MSPRNVEIKRTPAGLLFEIAVTPANRVIVRRIDGQNLTAEDRAAIRRVIFGDSGNTADSNAFQQENEADDLYSPTPYFDSTGNLIIPFNCSRRYRWWQNGQAISETIAELKAKKISEGR